MSAAQLSVFQQEALLSWIWEFSYIYKTDGFILEDLQPTEDEIYREKRPSPKVRAPTSGYNLQFEAVEYN
jgi:hypothetical protein